jgi:outer membrane protein, multidrug efflux system
VLIASVELIRSLGGGWNREQLPEDKEIQPFGILQYWDLDKPVPAGGIDVNADPADTNNKNDNLTVPLVPYVDQNDTNNTNNNLTAPPVP